jgi:phosphate starvation-inducible membrane PsiE
MPRPVFLSILFYVVLLTAILETNRDGRVQRLYWLPALFLVWANLHIQFIYGLFVLGLFVAAQLALRLTDSSDRARAVPAVGALPVKPLSLLFVGCLLATFIGPYGYHLYGVVVAYSKAHYSYEMIVELQPLSFRFSNHFVQLLLTGAGFVAAGWRKKIDPFKLALLIFASVVGFRTARDGWFVAITAAAVIADFPAAHEDEKETWIEHGAVVLTLVVFLFLLSRNFEFNERALDQTVSAQFPVDAAKYLRRNPLPGPLYNNLDWGGFLIWYLPQYPVAIDGRNDLYGDALDRTFHRAQDALQYKDDPYLSKAGCVLLDRTKPLATVLRFDPRFEVVYEDSNATIFGRR